MSSSKETASDEGTEANGTPTMLCSACEKESDSLKKCTACKCVWYCDKDCQKRHHKEHRRECKRIKKELSKRGGRLDFGTEKDVGPLGKLPPQTECPICMRVLPIHEGLQLHAACCGKTICGGCDFQHQGTSGKRTCAFCRESIAKTDEEILAQVHKRVELKDPIALCGMAHTYGEGELGLSVDQAKCIDLLRQAADLGLPGAHYELGNFHHDGVMGLEQDDANAKMHWEKAAEGGHLVSRYNVGFIEYKNGDLVAAMRHLRLSASGGQKPSMDILIACFELGLLHHGDLAETVRAMYLARAEMRSEGRDKYIDYLKMTGEYAEEYDC